MKSPHRSPSAHRRGSFRKSWITAGFLALLAGAPSSILADGLKSAQVSRIFNDVRLLPENQPARPAVVADTVTGKAAVQTGGGSRAELTFSDQTLTRLGANSYFSFVNGTRDLNLQSGTLLLQVPKGAGGATIHTAGITAGITGTTLMVEYNPKSYSKVVVLEGVVRVSLNGNPGESVLVHAGQILIVPAKAKGLPDPVSLDLKALYATSGLITSFGPLPSRGLIDQEVGQQAKKLDAGKLQNADLFIAGTGTQVQAGNLAYVAGNNVRITAQQGANTPVSLGGGRTVNVGKYGPLNLVAGNALTPAGTYDINTTTTIRTDPYITTNGKQDTGRIYRAGVALGEGVGPSVDGSSGAYLLGAATTAQFTPQSGSFDQTFNAVGDIAAFHFGSLALLGTPAAISTQGGPTYLALIADSAITDGPAGAETTPATVSLNGLTGLLLATRQGSITLNSGTTFQNTDNTAPDLTFYAQGGALDLEAGTRMNVGGGINLHGETGLTLNGVAQAVGSVAALSGGPMVIGANASVVSTAARVDLFTTTGNLTLNGTVQAGGTADLSTQGAGDLTVNGTITNTGTGTDSIVAVEASGGNLTLNGTVAAHGTCLLGAFNGGSTITVAAGASFSSAAAETTVIAQGGGFTLAGAEQSYTALSVSAAGGITLEAGSRLGSTTGTVTLNGGGALGVDGAVQAAGSVQATAGGGLGVGADGSFRSTNGQVFLQSTGGALNFSGTAAAQGQVVLQASGNAAVGSGANVASNGGNVYVYSNNATAVNNGTITAAGTAYLEGATVAQNGAVNAAGGLSLLSSGDLTASGTATTAATGTLQGDGTMTLNAAQLSADTLKLQVFGNNGTLLIGGGSVLTGLSQLNLFAGGAGGRIEFTGNTTLNSNVAAVLTASLIRIDNGVTVTINGPTALLYANTLQFSAASGGDGSTSGGFGGNGAVQAGNYTGGSATARATSHGVGAAAKAPTVSNRAGGAGAVSGPAAPSYDGRYGLSALVAGARPAAAGAAAGRGAVRSETKPRVVGKTASAASGQNQTPTTVLR